MLKIFIDPGHGGSDPGATANGLREKDICLKISLKLRNILNEKYTGHQIKLSRSSDQTLSLKERTDMANHWSADYLVSIHVNAGGGTGFESYIYNGFYANKMKTNHLRKYIHHEVVKATKFRDRGKKEANFHMLRESLMPAVLTENGFIDTVHNANLLKKRNFLQKIADAHAKGIAKAFGLTKRQKGSQDSSHHTEKYDQTYDSESNDLSGKNYLYHIVQQGDTLWNLANRYGTTVKKLTAWNHGVVPENLQIGQQLIIGMKNTGTYHTIQKGDTLWRLGVKYGTTVARLLEINRGVDPKRLQIGEVIRVK